jgi:5-methyltetrahydropteroyltriglutamate--homocysteine methyltransferase
VLDLSTEEVESVDTIKHRVRRALEHVAPERILLAPDCGMKYLSRDSAFGKLSNMAIAAAQLRDEL